MRTTETFFCDAMKETSMAVGLRILKIIICGSLLLACLSLGNARAHDAHRPELNDWFNRLESGRGPCCSINDGTALADVDWESKGGKYRVRIDGQWIDVPDDAVITEPNRDGRTMVWPMPRVFDSNGNWGSFGITVRCFIVGPMI